MDFEHTSQLFRVFLLLTSACICLLDAQRSEQHNQDLVTVKCAIPCMPIV